MDNQFVQGFGNDIDRQGLDSLVKALEAGYQVGANKTGGSALRVESLEASLKTLSYTHQHIKFWKKIPKSPAFSTVEEYNQVSDYGGYASPFVLEGELPQSADSVYARKYETVKFLGVTRSVTLQSGLVNTAHGDVVAQQNAEGILWLLSRVEHYLFHGDSRLAFSGNGPEWNGLDALIDATAVTDMAGEAILPTDLETITNQIVDDYGYPTDVYWPNKVQSDLAKSMYTQHRVLLPAQANGMIGQKFDAISTMAGDLVFNPCRFLTKRPSPRAAATSTFAPLTPASIVAGAVAGTTGDHNKGSNPAANTNYNYVVTACNRFGESAPTAVQGAVVTILVAEKAAGNYIPLTITNPANVGAYAPEYYRVYRSVASTSATVPATLDKYSLIAQVPAASQANNGTTVFNDLNTYLPFTSEAYIGEFTPSVLTFRQLAPLLKQDYAVVGPSFKWGILLFGTPILFAPKKIRKVTNIGDLVLA